MAPKALHLERRVEKVDSSQEWPENDQWQPREPKTSEKSIHRSSTDSFALAGGDVAGQDRSKWSPY